MKKTMRKIITALLIAVFIFSDGMVIKKYMDYREGEQTYNEVEQLAGIDIEESQPQPEEEEPGADEQTQDAEEKQNPLPKVSVDNLKQLDIDALQKVNKEVMGWIIIPRAGISYPLMDGDDNSYYLNHT